MFGSSTELHTDLAKLMVEASFYRMVDILITANGGDTDLQIVQRILPADETDQALVNMVAKCRAAMAR